MGWRIKTSARLIALGVLVAVLAACSPATLSAPSGSSASKAVANRMDSPAVGLIKKEARKQGVPTDLALAVAYKESHFRCSAVGRSGELGPLQIKPSTARGIGYSGSYSKLANSCALKVHYGVKHLAMAYKKFGRNNWKAAYSHNAGLYTKSFTRSYPKSYANSVVGMMKKF